MLLVLWDVDHTLIENGGVSREVYLTAFEILLGRPATAEVETDGRTDPQIMRELLASHGLIYQDDDRSRRALIEALARKGDDLRRWGHAMSGAEEVLQALEGSPEVVQTLLTGNVQPNAVVKLTAFGLADYVDFDIGGYGSDDEVRSRLVAVAQQRATRKHGVLFGPLNTVLIGDTPRDVHAALEGGARVVAVATGSSSVRDLRAAGADVVLQDLTDTAAVQRAIWQGDPGGLR
jgi:phosphoglycolate phosphatase-like HAD superfamily hydrolase